MIDHENKFIFIHVTKTAGTSIENAFDSSAGNTKSEVEYKHESASYMKNKFPTEWESYFTFSIVRNPFDRMLSRYTWGKRKNLWNRYTSSFNIFVKRIDEGKKVMSTPHRIWLREALKSQSQMLCNEDGDLLVDYIGKFENLQEDFNTICDKIVIPRQVLPHKNKSKHKHYTEYYNDETRSIVAKKYVKDIEMFGYEFGD